MKRSRRAFEVLVRGCSEDLYRFAFWLARDPDVAQDLVQETLLRAWRAMDQLLDASKARAWLLTTLRREFARLHERKVPAELLDLAPLEDVLATPEPEPGVLERDELMRRLLELPLEQREALALQVLFGYSIAEIATLLQISVAAANNHVFRARRQLLAGVARPARRATS